MPAAPSRLDEFMGKMLGDMGAAFSAALILMGDRLGLYKALAKGGALTPAELAQRTGTTERPVREWLAAQAAGGYVSYDAKSGRYSMNEEQKLTLGDDDSPACMLGAFEVIASAFLDNAKVAESFKSGKGLGWHEHDACLFRGTERFFRPGYAMNLVPSWLPALTGVVERLQKGARVADVGCGHGASSIVMAKAFPKSSFTGFDYHAPSIERARQAAAAAGVSANTRFEVGDSRRFPGKDWDLVAFFDCLHDMGDPAGAARHVRQALAADGTWLIVEPFAGDSTEANFNPVGRVFYSASTMICVPASLNQEGQAALGAQAGEKKLREVVTGAGFSRFRRAAETPFNLVLEARP